MTFRQSSIKHKCLDYAEKALKGLDRPKPIKYHILATLAQSEGLGYNGRQKLESVMYEALKDAIANGDPRFTFHGRGFFSLTEHGIMDYELPEYAADKRLGKNHPRRLAMEEERQKYIKPVCGRCHYIRFNGIKELTLEGGLCNNNQSGKNNVRFENPGCPFFIQRSEKRMTQDLERAYLLKANFELAQAGKKQRNSRKVKRSVNLESDDE